MRLAVLYVRGRGLPAALLVVAGVAAAGAGAAAWLVTRPSLDGTARLPVAVAAALATAVVLGDTLHSEAHELEAATPADWRRWRVAHVTAAALAAALLLAPALPATAYGAAALLRNAAGLLGLALLSATCAGARLAWTLPAGYAFTVYLAAGTGDAALRPLWAFLLQPAGSRAAAVTAGTLLALGTTAWTLAAHVPASPSWATLPAP